MGGGHYVHTIYHPLIRCHKKKEKYVDFTSSYIQIQYTTGPFTYVEVSKTVKLLALLPNWSDGLVKCIVDLYRTPDVIFAKKISLATRGVVESVISHTEAFVLQPLGYTIGYMLFF